MSLDIEILIKGRRKVKAKTEIIPILFGDIIKSSYLCSPVRKEK